MIKLLLTSNISLKVCINISFLWVWIQLILQMQQFYYDFLDKLHFDTNVMLWSLSWSFRMTCLLWCITMRYMPIIPTSMIIIFQSPSYHTCLCCTTLHVLLTNMMPIMRWMPGKSLVRSLGVYNKFERYLMAAVVDNIYIECGCSNNVRKYGWWSAENSIDTGWLDWNAF